VSLIVRTMGLDMLLASTMKTSVLIVMQVCTCSILHKYGLLLSLMIEVALITVRKQSLASSGVCGCLSDSQVLDFI